VLGSVAFWFICWGMNYGRHCLIALEADMPPLRPALRGLAEAGYWILPKPVDLGMMLHNALNAGDSFGSLPELQKVQELGGFSPELFLLTSVLFPIGMIFIAARQLASTDY
jgi:hypothetical protein